MRTEAQQSTATVVEFPKKNKAPRKTKRGAAIPDGLALRGKTYHICVSLGQRNKKHRESTHTGNLELATKRLVEVQRAIWNDRHMDIKKKCLTTFKDLATAYRKVTDSRIRAKGNATKIDVWTTGLGNVMVRDITEVMIQGVMDEHKASTVAAGRGFTNSSENRYLSKLKAILNWGVSSKMIDSNPAASMKDKKEAGNRTGYLKQEELQRLLSDPLTADYMKHMILMAVCTGMRRDELLSLLWADVNLEARYLIVKQSKSGKQRSIPINDTLLALFQTLPSKDVFEFVFTHERTHLKTGEVIGQGKIRETNHEWRRATKRAKLDHFRFHDLRHSFASHIVQAKGGISVELRDTLGHSSMSMSERYSHVADAAALETVRSLDRLKLTIPAAAEPLEPKRDTHGRHSLLESGMGILQVF